ncbi:class I SAM-dependent methyltransferase [Chelatococcus sp. YT9]|uniref:class I SAM-dependent methyltransferase n=1 Tax=Chelatococcus sp. YT9 TaxID=2835635 RepID=UPI001BCF4CBB|nr:class I SAM-dependent methyltransferase [Chelatococcus sp. YT9]MBS7699074.1 class I SAM-dependent methyltransferase [Chelatococcus sp. YT9]
MKPIRFLATACAASILSLGVAMAQPAQPAQPGTPTYQPESGQAGKDVVWVPTHQSLVDRMLEMAEVTPNDYLIDLGSGDGRTVITAAKRGLRAHGIEYNPDLVALSQRAAESEGVKDKATFAQGDIFETDFSDATVLTLFLLPELNLRLRPTILEMKPGTRVVSNTFMMDDWEPDQSIESGADCKSFCRAHKWIVPAKVDGTWKLDNGELKLTQKFQMLSGELIQNGKSSPLTDARMNGAEITFTADGRVYKGRVTEGRMESAGDANGPKWSATRSST